MCCQSYCLSYVVYSIDLHTLSLHPLKFVITNAYAIWAISIQQVEKSAQTLWNDELNQEFYNDNEPFMICAKSP
jgi:hypothetical protein